MSAAMAYEGLEVPEAQAEKMARGPAEAWRLIDNTDPGPGGYVASCEVKLAEQLALEFLGTSRRSHELLPGLRYRLSKGIMMRHASSGLTSYRPRRFPRCPA